MFGKKRSAWQRHALAGAVVALFALCAFAGVGSAASTVVVDDGSHCSNPNTSSIQSAIYDNATDGSTIQVCAGTYDENVTVNKSVTIEANTTGGPVVLNASGHANGFTLADGTDNVTIRGFQVENFSSAGVNAIGANRDITLENNTLAESSAKFGIQVNPTGQQHNSTSHVYE